MDLLSKDVLFNIATMLDLDNLISFCNSDQRINKVVCQRDAIWLFKLAKEFPNYKSHINQRGREAYELLISLVKLKKGIKYKRNIYKLYETSELDLSNKGITLLPPEIGKLNNLKELYLNGNQIVSLPFEIGNLSNLEVLYVSNNQIVSLPSEIGNLNQLKYLYLNNNKIKILLPEIGKLTQLRRLYLENNEITSLPPEIDKLSNLKKLSLDKTVLIPQELKHLYIKYV